MPFDVGEAVTSFRADTGQLPGPSPVPVGVYVYATNGFEKTKEVFIGVTHQYPPRSTITVTKEPCGVQMRWDVLKGRSTTWTFCIDASGWVMTKQCRTTHVLRGEGGDDLLVLECPFQDARRHTRASVVGDLRNALGGGARDAVGGRPRAVRVGGTRVSAVHVRQTKTISAGEPAASPLTTSGSIGRAASP